MNSEVSIRTLVAILAMHILITDDYLFRQTRFVLPTLNSSVISRADRGVQLFVTVHAQPRG